MVVVAIMMMRMPIMRMVVTTIMMMIIMMLVKLGVSNGMKEVVETLGSLEVIEPSILYFNPPTCFAQSLTSPKPEYRFHLYCTLKVENVGGVVLYGGGDGDGALQVEVVGGAVLHSKKGGDG